MGNNQSKSSQRQNILNRKFHTAKSFYNLHQQEFSRKQKFQMISKIK